MYEPFIQFLLDKLSEMVQSIINSRTFQKSRLRDRITLRLYKKL